MRPIKALVQDALDNAVPWVEEVMECPRCLHQFELIRQIGVSWRVPCAYCRYPVCDFAALDVELILH